MCYSIYHPLDSELALSDAGVIIERAPREMDGERALRECSSQRCPGESPEIFEKSIDKHEIDAILNRRPVGNGPGNGLFSVGERGRRIPLEESGPTIPIQGFRKDSPGAFLCLCAGKGNGARILRPVFGGVL